MSINELIAKAKAAKQKQQKEAMERFKASPEYQRLQAAVKAAREKGASQ